MNSSEKQTFQQPHHCDLRGDRIEPDRAKVDRTIRIGNRCMPPGKENAEKRNTVRPDGNAVLLGRRGAGLHGWLTKLHNDHDEFRLSG